MWYLIREDELYHHGIKGQKWGVRRFQNYDGTYTQKGLKRYQNSLQKYNDTVKKFESGRADKYDVKAAKKKMNKDYKQLRLDKKADKGKELYKRGKRITSNDQKAYIAEVGVAASSYAAKKVLEQYTNKKVSTLAASAIAIGGTFVNGAVAVKTGIENSRLRAFYGH